MGGRGGGRGPLLTACATAQGLHAVCTCMRRLHGVHAGPRHVHGAASGAPKQRRGTIRSVPASCAVGTAAAAAAAPARRLLRRHGCCGAVAAGGCRLRLGGRGGRLCAAAAAGSGQRAPRAVPARCRALAGWGQHGCIVTTAAKLSDPCCQDEAAERRAVELFLDDLAALC